ncbi:hypothetical protein V5799_030992 [Amblyomma americanum]|uniref:Transmembrane protein n=1 Tax=Amblyomma americanum TaxID=6943 RepID=A0AAQ4EM19_AMBAM
MNRYHPNLYHRHLHEYDTEVSLEVKVTHRLLKTGCIIVLPLLWTITVVSASAIYLSKSASGSHSPPDHHGVKGRVDRRSLDSETTREWEDFTPLIDRRSVPPSRPSAMSSTGAGVATKPPPPSAVPSMDNSATIFCASNLNKVTFKETNSTASGMAQPFTRSSSQASSSKAQGAPDHESENTSPDLLSTHRMLKTSCIILLPLFLTFLITAVSLAYMAANADGRSDHLPSPTIARRHAADYDAETHPRRRRETGVAAATKTTMAPHQAAGASPSSSGNAEQDIYSYFKKRTLSTARKVTNVPAASGSTTKKGWFAVAASWNPPRLTKKAPTTTVTTLLASTRKQHESGLVDAEDISDVGDKVDQGQRGHKLRRRTRKPQLPRTTPSSTITEEDSTTMGIMELLGFATRSTRVRPTAMSAERQRPPQRNGPALIRRRQRSPATTSGRPSRLPPRVRDRLFNRPRRNPFPRISPITTNPKKKHEDISRRRRYGDEKAVPGRLAPALVTGTTPKTWPHDLLAAESEAFSYRPQYEDDASESGRSLDRRLTRRLLPRQSKSRPQGGTLDGTSQRRPKGTRRLALFKPPTTTAEPSFPVGTEDGAGLITEDYYEED